MKSRPAYRRQLFDRVIEMLLLIGIEAYVDAVHGLSLTHYARQRLGIHHALDILGFLSS